MKRVPPIRSSVEIVETGDERMPARLVDPDLSQKIRLDPLGFDVVRQLSDETTLEALAVAVDADERAVGRIVATLERLQVLDTDVSLGFIESQRAAKAMAEFDPMTVPLLIRDDAAFTCSMCGSCCGGQNVGPVSDAKIAELRPHFPILRELTGAKKPFFMEVPVKVDGVLRDTTICQSSMGSCIFLGTDRLCTIHREFGGEAKPKVCQIFPYQFKATPEGIAVSLGMECRGFVEARQGAKLKDQEADIRRMLAQVPISTMRAVARVDDTSAVGFEAYSELEERLHEVVDVHADDSAAALLAMRDVLQALRLRERDGEKLPAISNDRDELISDLETFQEDMLHSLGDLHDTYHQVDDRLVIHTGSLDHFARGVVGLLPDLRRVIRPLRKKVGRELFVEYAHHSLMGKELLRARNLVLGLARFNFSWLLTKAMAIDRVRQVKRRHLIPQDIQDCLGIVHFLFRGQDAISGLRHHDSQIISLFYDRLPLLVEIAPSLALAREPAMLYKF